MELNPTQHQPFGMSMPGVAVQVRQKLYDLNMVKTEDRYVTLKKITPKPMGGNKRPRNTADYVLRGYKMPGTDTWVVFPTGVRPDGTFIFEVLRIRGSKSYNLNKLREAQEYFAWINSEYYSGSQLFYASGRDERDALITDDPQRDAERFIKGRLDAKGLEEKVLNADDNTVKDWAVIFKINPNSNSVAMLKQSLIQRIEANPNKFREDIGEGSDQAMVNAKIVLHKALFSGIIREDMERGTFIYRDSRELGSSAEQVMRLLVNDSAFGNIVASEANEAIPTSNIRTIKKHEILQYQKDQEMEKSRTTDILEKQQIMLDEMRRELAELRKNKSIESDNNGDKVTDSGKKRGKGFAAKKKEAEAKATEAEAFNPPAEPADFNNKGFVSEFDEDSSKH